MKKNKFSFLVVASLLALSSLVGCNNTPVSSGNNASSGNNNSQQTSSSTNPGENSNSSSNGNNSSPSSLVPSSSSQPGGNTSTPQPSSSASNPQPSSSQPGSSTSSGPASSSQSGSSNSSSPNVKTEWTAEEKVLMGNHLHGLVLPFVNMPVSVTYTEYANAITIASTENMKDGFLREYASLYDYDSGWEGGDASYELGLTPGVVYVFRKAVVENRQTRYVVVYFSGAEYNATTQDIDYSPTGLFYLQASDPFIYQYPAEFINNWLKTTFSADILPPALEAEYYELDSEGVLYAYSETNLESAYKQLLEATNKFVVKAEKDAEGYYVAYPTDGSYQIRFKYDADQKVMIVEVGEYKGWSSALINKFYQKYNQTPLEFPSLDIDGASYKFEEDSYNSLVAGQGIYSRVSATYTISKTGLTNAPLVEYAKKLREAGYSICGVADDENGTINTYYFMKALKDGVFYSSQISYEKTPIGGGKPQIVMYFFAAGQEMPDILANWPSDKIATFLGSDVKDVVPAYTGIHCGFGFESNKYAVVTINVDEIASASIKDDYTALLLRNKYTLDGQKFISENNQISIQLAEPQGYGAYDVFQIRIDKISAPVDTPWPTEDVANAIKEHLKLYNLETFEEIPITDAIPALDVAKASECYVSTPSSDGFEIYIAGLANKQDDFKAVLKTAGWSEDPFYGFDTTISEYGVFISPNKQIVIYFDVVGSDLSLRVNTYWDQHYATWPSSEMNPIISAWGVTKDVIPAFDSAYLAQWENPESTKTINIMVMVGRGLEQLFNDTYKNALTKAGYSFDENRGGYVTENGELLIKVGVNQTTTLLEVNVIYIGQETPVPAKDFKLVGLNNNWNYDESELVFVDATNPDEVAQLWYVTQSKVEFDVENGTEFKVTDGTTWLGMSDVEEMGAELFSEGSYGNIKANKKGHVTLYLKTYTDGRLGLAIRFEEEAPELSPWPEEEINEFFGDAFDSVPEIKIADASYEVEDKIELEDSKTMVIIVTVADAQNKRNAAIVELTRQFGYVYDPDTMTCVTETEGLPIYAFEAIDDNSFKVSIIYVPAEEVPEKTWANAQAAMLEYLGEEKELPNLELEGAVAYDVEYDVLTISFPEGTDPYESMLALFTKLQNNGYHYARYLDAFVNIDKGLIMTITGSLGAIEVEYNSFVPENEGYGIVAYYEDPEEGVVYVPAFAEFNKEENNVTEYLISGFEFKAGMRFYAYNFGAEQDFVLAIDSYSLAQQYADYIEFDEEYGEYVIKQDFTADIYLKLQYGNDVIYLGFTAE